MKYEKELAEHFRQEKVLSEEAYQTITQQVNLRKLSLHWELRTLLYTGITLLTTGLGVFVYKNIGTIGHIAMIFLLFAACGFCYLYAFRHALPYSRNEVKHDNPFYDYIVLLAGSLFVIAQGYVEFRFGLFGNALNIASLLASFFLFFTAFRFDHRGVLGIGISLHALAFGLTVRPLNLLTSGFGAADTLSYACSSLALGAMLCLYAFACRKKQVKPHFVTVFLQSGITIVYLGLLTLIFSTSYGLLWYLGLLAFSILCFSEAKQNRSFALYLTMILANYIALSYWILKTAFYAGSIPMAIYLLPAYFIVSALGIIRLLRDHKKMLGYDKVH